MEFKTATQEAVYNKVKPMMTELFGETGAQPREDIPQFIVRAGSALVLVSVISWKESVSLITALSWVTRGSDLNADCMKYLLNQNHDMIFGAFSVDVEGDIAFSNTIVGETCDKDELKHLVMAVAVTADKEDDIIVGRWGGQRAVDG